MVNHVIEQPSRMCNTNPIRQRHILRGHSCDLYTLNKLEELIKAMNHMIIRDLINFCRKITKFNTHYWEMSDLIMLCWQCYIQFEIESDYIRDIDCSVLDMQQYANR